MIQIAHPNSISICHLACPLYHNIHFSSLWRREASSPMVASPNSTLLVSVLVFTFSRLHSLINVHYTSSPWTIYYGEKTGLLNPGLPLRYLPFLRRTTEATSPHPPRKIGARKCIYWTAESDTMLLATIVFLWPRASLLSYSTLLMCDLIVKCGLLSPDTCFRGWFSDPDIFLALAWIRIALPSTAV